MEKQFFLSKVSTKGECIVVKMPVDFAYLLSQNYEYMNNFMRGRILTLIEATITDAGQQKAVKDMIHEIFNTGEQTYNESILDTYKHEGLEDENFTIDYVYPVACGSLQEQPNNKK